MDAGQYRLGLLLEEVDEQDGEGVGGQGALGLPVQPHQVGPEPGDTCWRAGIAGGNWIHLAETVVTRTIDCQRMVSYI